MYLSPKLLKLPQGYPPDQPYPMSAPQTSAPYYTRICINAALGRLQAFPKSQVYLKDICVLYYLSPKLLKLPQGYPPDQPYPMSAPQTSAPYYTRICINAALGRLQAFPTLCTTAQVSCSDTATVF